MKDRTALAHKTLFFFTWLVLAVFTVELFNLFKIENVNKFNFSSLAPAGIQVMSNIKNNTYNSYIQTIYTKENQKNELIIIIKPYYWQKITTNEKTAILSKVKEEWRKIYQKDTPGYGEPEVSYANN